MTDFAEADLDQLDLPQAAAVLEGLLLRRWEPRDPRPFKERLISGASWRQEQRAEAYRILRNRLLAEAPAEFIPTFLRQFRELPQVETYLRGKSGSTQQDLEEIWSGFGPLRDALEVPAATAESRRKVDTAPTYRPQVTDRQRHVLDKLLSIYLEAGDWPTHAYLEQELEDGGIELDRELREMPEWVFFPDNRRHGGVLYFQDQERISLMIRGLVACSEGDREVEMLVATIRWAVQERKSVRQRPHELVEKRWRAADAMAAMEAVVSPAALPAWSCKLVLELLRMEPADLPKWSGQPDGFPEWELDIPTGIKRFREVETIDDYLAETDPQVPRNLPLTAPVPQLAAVIATAARVDVVEHPIFDRLIRRDEMFQCFVLLPLSEPFKSIYNEAVEPVAAELGVTCGHAASIFGPGRIMKDVVASITFAEVIVAELTGRNPNVFYELGIAHEQGKQVVLLSQDIKDVPFDLRDMRVVEYSWSGSEADAETLRTDLRPNLEKALQAARDAEG